MNIDKEIATLRRMSVAELRKKHIEAFGEPNGSGHKDYLVKRIAWRLQSQQFGDLTERARRRAAELANDADLRSTAPKTDTAKPVITAQVAIDPNHDPRIPLPGSIVTRNYRGRDIVVKVLPNGFEFEGEIYRSLSAIAKAITGTHWNGLLFFGLKPSGAANA